MKAPRDLTCLTLSIHTIQLRTDKSSFEKTRNPQKIEK